MFESCIAFVYIYLYYTLTSVPFRYTCHSGIHYFSAQKFFAFLWFFPPHWPSCALSVMHSSSKNCSFISNALPKLCFILLFCFSAFSTQHKLHFDCQNGGLPFFFSFGYPFFSIIYIYIYIYIYIFKHNIYHIFIFFLIN